MPDQNLPQSQETIDRVQTAIQRHASRLEQELQLAGSDAAQPVLLRCFKKEKVLELWKKEKSSTTYQLFKSYRICATSGNLGPKLREGDKQVPEGFYHIKVFNPKSAFHLSLGINYPNEADKKYCDAQHPGGDIYIHGGCASIGCLAMTDLIMEEIYLLCYWAKEHGQDQIPVHILPFDPLQNSVEQMILTFSPDMPAKWRELFSINEWFERNKQPPEIQSSADGKYTIITGEMH